MRIRIGKSLWLGLTILAATALAPRPALAIPAFARKYGLPCSACHEA